jgi:polar amino acid transport system substrate-binding protein
MKELAMQRLFRSTLILLVCSLVMSCNRSGDAGSGGASRGLDEVVKTRVLRAGYVSYPPSMTIDPSTKAKGGIMVDVMGAVAKAMEIKVDYTEETSFATMVDTLDSGRVDVVVSGIWPSSTRALRADFSRVVYYSPVYAYVRSDDTRFDGKLATANDPAIKVATVDGELSSIVAQSDYPKAAQVSLPQQTDVSQLLLQLSAKKADITFVEPAIADAFLAKNPGSIKRVGGVPPVRVFPNCFLFRKGDTQLRDAINIAIVELTNSGEIASLVKPYDPQGSHFVIPVPPVTP